MVRQKKKSRRRKKDTRTLVRKARKYLKSPEGQKGQDRALASSRARAAEMKEARTLDEATLNIPFTI